MSRYLKIAAIPTAGFWRAGVHWPHAGRIMAETDLDPEGLARLRAEPRLRITPAEAPETTTMRESADETVSAIIAMISELPADAFASDGKPKLEALRKALGSGVAVTAEMRDAAWAAARALPQE